MLIPLAFLCCLGCQQGEQVAQQPVTDTAKDIRSMPGRQTLSNNNGGEIQLQVSPDGKWIAHVSSESGKDVIFIRPSPNAVEAKRRVPTKGGSSLRWSSDGSKLLYLNSENELVAVPMEDIEAKFHAIKGSFTETEVAVNSVHSIIGSWKLNISKSTFAPNSPPPPKENTEVYRELNNGLVEFKGRTIREDGSSTSLLCTWPMQGGEVTILEGNFPENITWIQTLIESEWYTTQLKDGKQKYTRHKVVNDDGKILRQTYRSTDDQGKPYKNILIYDRQ